MKIVKTNLTGKQPLPVYEFSGKDKPNDIEWFEIIRRFETHFSFIRVYGFNPDVAFTYFNYFSNDYKDETHYLVLKPCGSNVLSLEMVLAILQALNDLPDFVSIVEE